MKQKLEALAEEMILEVKNLKDLAKEELPEVAKEYIRFQYVSSLVFASLFALGLGALYGVIYYTTMRGEG